MQNAQKVEWLLRIGVAGEFAGHGFLAIGGKKDWLTWISQLTNASAADASTLLLLIGFFDLAVALIVLVRPIKAILLWATFWGFWTALVRPIVGVGWLDFVERSANWAAPLALLFHLGWPRSAREWFRADKTSG